MRTVSQVRNDKRLSFSFPFRFCFGFSVSFPFLAAEWCLIYLLHNPRLIFASASLWLGKSHSSSLLVPIAYHFPDLFLFVRLCAGWCIFHVSMWSEFGLCIKSLFDAKRNPPPVEYSVFAFLNWSQSSSRAVTYIIYSTFKMLFSLTCKWQLRSWLHAVPPVILTEYGLSWMRWKELARREYEMHSGDLWCCYARWYQ